MRVISGILKGKPISFLKNSNTRPLKDSVKENIFNILKHSNVIKVKIEKSNVLDLYCGSGSFGIECGSRGAHNMTFVDKDISATKVLKKNLTNLSLINKSNIFSDNIEDVLKSFNKKFNIFFLDPPYANNDFINNLKKIKEEKLFETNHIVIIHREKKTEDYYNNYFKIIDTKIYGRSKIIFGVFT
jgi:16S rRNA (guanine966-N2)-methyltransferase